jgi:hypothetical protein
MMYNYEVEKHKIFTDEGQRNFLKVRDCARKHLNTAGAFMLTYAWDDLGCHDTWESMAYVDRMVELGEIREITKAGVSGQYRVFVRTING